MNTSEILDNLEAKAGQRWDGEERRWLFLNTPPHYLCSSVMIANATKEEQLKIIEIARNYAVKHVLRKLSQ